MSDKKQIIGLAEYKDGNRKIVSITVNESDSDVFQDFEMKIMLNMSCKKQNLRLLEVCEIKYV